MSESGERRPVLRVALVDDEPLVREGIARQLAGLEGVEIVGQAGDGAAAIELLTVECPDLVFLDVQMPECDGFEVLRALPEDARPAVVFVTAYDEYAIRAFEFHAVDYLLKPFDDERFAVALARARARVEETGAAPDTRLEPMLRELAAAGRTSRRLAVRSRGRIRFVDVDEVDWVESAGNYACLHVGEASHLHRSSLAELAERFPDRLLRIHRSTLVAADRVVEIRPLTGGDATVHLTDGTTLKLSRTWRDEFESRMTR